MAQENPLVTAVPPEEAPPSLWQRGSKSVLQLAMEKIFGAPPPPWEPLGQRSFMADGKDGANPLANFNVSALERFAGTNDASPYLDYLTGRKPWLFSDRDMTYWMKLLRDNPGQESQLAPSTMPPGVTRRLPTEAERSLLVQDYSGMRRSPLAYYGFNPENTLLLTGQNRTKYGGIYHPGAKAAYVALNEKANDTALMHESLHAAFDKLRGKKNRTANNYREDDEENAVRIIMATQAGNSEKAHMPDNTKVMLERVLPHINNQKLDTGYGAAIRKLNEAAAQEYFKERGLVAPSRRW